MTQKVATKRKMKSRQETTSLGYFDSDGKAVNTRGDTPLYKLYRYVPPHRVGFLRRLGLKTGTHFAHFGLESGMVCEGTTGVYERLLFKMSKKARRICQFEMG